LPVFDASLKHPNEYRKYDMKLVWKTPRQELMHQFKQSRIYREDGMKGLAEWEHTPESMKGPIKKLSMYQEMQKNNGKIPIIVEEYNVDGSVHNFQEGRTRSQIAIALGIKKIPILQAFTRDFRKT